MKPESEKSNENAVPDWDMSAYFPEFGGPDYRAFRERLAGDIADLQEVVATLAPMDEAPEAWASFAARLEDLFARHRHLGSYLGCLQAADANDCEVEHDAAALSVSRGCRSRATVDFGRSTRAARSVMPLGPAARARSRANARSIVCTPAMAGRVASPVPHRGTGAA